MKPCRKPWWAPWLLVSLLPLPSTAPVVRAQPGDASPLRLSPPREQPSTRRAGQQEVAQREADAPEREEGSRAPLARVELHYATFFLADPYGGGRTHLGGVGGYLALPVPWLRLASWAQFGVRDYPPGEDDLLLRLNVLAGYQHGKGVGILRPYVGASLHAGVLFAKRFSTPVQHVLWGFGLEGGGELRVYGRSWVGLTAGWTLARMRGATHHLFVFRARVGL